MSADDNDDEVGYRKPPRHSRFKKGRSVNPHGRPKGALARANTIFDKLLNKKLTVRDAGGQRKLTVREAGLELLVNSAVKGDPESMALIVSMLCEFGAIAPPPSPPRYSGVLVVDAYRSEAEYLEWAHAQGQDNE